MPNWVYNHIGGWSKELHDKYKSETREIDFDKVIPMPEEIKDSVSCSYNDHAKQIVEYNKFKEKVIQKKVNGSQETIDNELKYNHDNPLRDEVKTLDQRVALDVGHLCIENPDEPLNELLEKKENNWIKSAHQRYTAVFGKSSFDKRKDAEKMFSDYIDLLNKEFKRFQGNRREGDGLDSIIKFENLEEYGKHLKEIGEKYGYDNWYDWSWANWGVKWNASDSEYDEESEQIKFDTPWGIPYPILAKVAEQNPNIDLDGYSEEEFGWFEEYNVKDKKVTITAKGENDWDRETGETIQHREELKPRTVIYFENDELKQEEE